MKLTKLAEVGVIETQAFYCTFGLANQDLTSRLLTSINTDYFHKPSVYTIYIYFTSLCKLYIQVTMTNVIQSIITTWTVFIFSCIMTRTLSIILLNHLQDPIYYFIIRIKGPTFLTKYLYHRGGLRCRFPCTIKCTLSFQD